MIMNSELSVLISNSELLRYAWDEGKCNGNFNPWSDNGFWFNEVYIINIFSDKTGRKNFTINDSIEYYGEDNILKYLKNCQKMMARHVLHTSKLSPFKPTYHGKAVYPYIFLHQNPPETCCV